MIVSLNTDICPIIIPDTYGTDFCHYVSEEMWEDFKQLMVAKAKDAIVYALDDLDIPYTEIIMGGFYSPRQYNFSTDWIDFELELPDDYIKYIKETVGEYEAKEFFNFTKKHFGSHDGFISFYPYETKDFYKSEDADYIVSMWIMYRMSQENDIEAYQRDYLEDVEEYASGNGYFEDEEDD